MYNFRDTTENSEYIPLPSEAMQINGEYIENQIVGYRTLYVKGREMLAPEITQCEVGARDGALLQGKRYPARTITIGYQLAAASADEFRSAYNTLNSILNVTEAELIFADESDKYFVGTPCGFGEVEPGRNIVVGEFDILCTDPFKYSVQEHEASPSLDDGTTFAVDYNGTYRAYPVLEASFPAEEESEDSSLTGNGDCGYVVFMDEDENVIQLGDPEESDGEELPKSQTLTSQKFDKWDSAVQSRWKTNVGRFSSSSHVQQGTFKIFTTGSSKMLTPDSYGSSVNGWHGPTITRTLPADASGEIGAVNWRATWKQLFAIGTEKDATKEKGFFQCHLVNTEGSSKKIVAGFGISKNKTGTKAFIRFYINDEVVGEDITIDVSHYNKYFGWTQTVNGEKKTPVRTSTIQKKKAIITYNIAGIKKSFIVPEVASMKVHEMTFGFAKWKDQTAMSSNCLYWGKFINDRCETYRDIPNKFSAGDVVSVNCEDGSIYLNDSPAPELGALGNDYEDFCLNPGTNQIGVAWSDWTTEAPICKLRYREVFI